MNPQKNSGVALLVVIGALAIAGALGLWVFKPKALHGESKRAEQSEQVSAEVKAAHEKEIAAEKKRSSEAAASSQVMASVVASLPATPEKQFLTEEGKVLASKLESPDPTELLKAEQRKNAVLTGKVAEAELLYSQALQHSSELSRDLVQAKEDTSRALAARDAVDRNLNETAALHRGMERQRNMTILALAALAAVYLWTKLTHLSPGAMAEAVADIKKGVNGVDAIDLVTTRSQQKLVAFWQKHFH